jgi:hypothetical protein
LHDIDGLFKLKVNNNLNGLWAKAHKGGPKTTVENPFLKSKSNVLSQKNI